MSGQARFRIPVASEAGAGGLLMLHRLIGPERATEWTRKLPPPEGWTLAEAICHGHKMEWAILAAHMQARAGMGDHAEVARLRAILWPKIVAQVAAGELTVTGFWPGMKEPENIPTKFLAAAEPDDGSLRVGEARYHGVRLTLPDSLHSDTEPPTRSQKSVSNVTKLAVKAIYATARNEPNPPRTARGLARFAAEKAQEQGQKGADLLNPEGRTMRDIAEAFLEVDKE